MSKKAFDKIAEGLNEALPIARGEGPWAAMGGSSKTKQRLSPILGFGIFERVLSHPRMTPPAVHHGDRIGHAPQVDPNPVSASRESPSRKSPLRDDIPRRNALSAASSARLLAAG